MKNKLYSPSFERKNTNCNIDDMQQELEALIEIIAYCKEISEPIELEEDIWECIVGDNNMRLCDWVFGTNTRVSADVKRFFTECLTKPSKKVSDENVILCGLVNTGDVVTCMKEYLDARLSFLEKNVDQAHFIEFSKTCFRNLIFSKECYDGIKRVERFSDVKCELTHSLKCLDKNAVEVYAKSNKDAVEASRRMSIIVGKTCSPDPNNMNKLVYTFEDNENNKVNVCCHIHLKLCRDDSNMRVYYWWNGEKIGKANKTLIGWIDGHPY